MTASAPRSIFATLIAALLAAIPTWAAETKPNIVLILADDLGINDLGCYGRKEHHTPNLDKLASQGMRFTASYCAQPICSPARAAILTGQAPARLHLTTFLPGRADCASQKLLHPRINQQLPLEQKTLAEYLKAAGYATACVGKWHLGGAKFGPKEQGFDFVHAGTANTKPSATEGGKGEYDLTLRAIEFIAANKDKPFFLYLPHNTPHIPLAARPELIEKYKEAFNPTYAAMMHSMDETVGMLLAKLDELKLAERTIVIFTSDNGGLHVLEFPDSPATHNAPFRAGKAFVYEGGLRVPLIVRWPGVVPAGKVTDVPVSQLDYTPTLLEACGAKGEGTFDGMSVVPLLKGGKIAERTLYWHFPHYTNQGSRPAGAVREGHWKLVEHYEDGRVELYDLAKDAGEEVDLAKREPDRAKSMKSKLAAWRKSVDAQENSPNPGFDATLYQKLYTDVDVSKLKPERTAALTRARFQEWRKAMNAVVPKKKSKP
jgi:arylsulfatase A-like enzyme